MCFLRRRNRALAIRGIKGRNTVARKSSCKMPANPRRFIWDSQEVTLAGPDVRSRDGLLQDGSGSAAVALRSGPAPGREPE
jgi:hypothetical protein